MKIKVSVPATSANIGSGFDALGLAVTLYNTVTFEESDHLDISAADGTRIPRGETNLVYRSAKGLFDKVGKTMPPLKLVQTNAIPMARGLGSSSACIIAGLLGANRMLGITCPVRPSFRRRSARAATTCWPLPPRISSTSPTGCP